MGAHFLRVMREGTLQTKLPLDTCGNDILRLYEGQGSKVTECLVCRTCGQSGCPEGVPGPAHGPAQQLLLQGGGECELRTLPKSLARSARVSVTAVRWCRVGAGSPLPWLPRVPQGAFVMPVDLRRALSPPKEAVSARYC